MQNEARHVAARLLLGAMLMSFGVVQASGDDVIDTFLASHWQHPIAAQGTPPDAFSAQEASLDPRHCGECHPQQHADWSRSLHRQTMGAGILWQARALAPDQVLRCLNCHAPLAEQKALLAQQMQWPGVGSEPPPDYVPTDLHQQGLVCAACHIRAHERFGPPPSAGKPEGDTAGLPHGGFTSSPAFEDSRFCATCHQFPDGGPALNGKLLENTYREWSESGFAAEGRSCQSCHMPERRHLWRGIHDADMVREALSVYLDAGLTDDEAIRVEAIVRNVGAGHFFPTYLVPKVWVRLLLLDPQGRVQKTLDEEIVTRETDLWLTEEISDTRIPPGGVRGLSARLDRSPGQGWYVELRVDVAPREHYEQMFATVMRNNARDLDEVTRAELAKALREARASRFTALSIRKPLSELIAN